MYLSHLTLENYRSHAAVSFDLSAPGVTVLLGPNGSGKTNVLEAVSVLSLGRSALGAEEADQVRWEEAFFRVRGRAAADNGEEYVLEVACQMAPRRVKAYFVSDVRVPAGRFVGSLPTVVFLPQTPELFAGPPAHRRQFLDQLLSQVSPEHFAALAQYGKVLRQRNALLKKIAEGIAAPEDLSVWDGTLADLGSRITLRRLELLETLQCTLPEELASLGERFPGIALRYVRKGAAREQEAAAEELLRAFAQSRERDVLLQSTTTGPHREDWILDASGRAFCAFASRGQQRAAVLALLFLEVSYLELQRGEKPVVLLDDVFSELDDAHQEALFACLAGNQVLVTATHLPGDVRDVRVIAMAGDAKCMPATSAVR